MSHTSIHDDSLVALENHPSLVSLSLLSTNISDDGLCHLHGMNSFTQIMFTTFIFIVLRAHNNYFKIVVDDQLTFKLVLVIEVFTSIVAFNFPQFGPFQEAQSIKSKLRET